MAEKRTAETKSKLAASQESGQDTSEAAAAAVPDPGLALLPIITILCGVAIGLGTVALGVVMLVRGRGHEEEGGEGEDDEGRGNRGKKYDAVATEEDLVAERQIRHQENQGK